MESPDSTRPSLSLIAELEEETMEEGEEKQLPVVCFCYLSWVLCFLFSSFPFLSFLSGHTVWLTGSWLPDQIRLGSSRWEH